MPPGKALIVAGLVLVAIGLLFTFGGKLPYLGRLPGDIRIEKENFTFYFPLTTCILLSALVSLLIWLFRR
ncbi:MAG: DUF2905 domain-containing protein [Desulfuromonadales bacterium]|nr:DUF2905 domain-containing protein [Desulfuromonadales bacterium]NIR33483.1 DUF2905 domain-containing protein [Desulfuromonadales bacterium]NIS41051.1 DUF2905 domain-containing protein [Desulfuromonadales bacterium]